ncbi:AT-rich interactive domain-containing protein 3-like isoform X2 [Magnolia sinica]|uniref:AT-rich interactive domain-containing protein 3-like isoform X2 n=1 Tax=Magnolia sinica TaxID=86752 RepID=UPI0026597AFF|nr:AT-rich interactive domain-containing protein 3-like isoform X2 [Magnolia sinica]
MSEAKDTENHTQVHFSNNPDTIDLPPEPGPTNQSGGSESKNNDKDTARHGEMPDAEPETENGAGEVRYEKNLDEDVPPLLSNQEAIGLIGNTGSSSRSFPWDPQSNEGDDSGTDEEQATFMKELESFFRGRGMEFKPPKFYGEGLNCLKLWRAVIRLGGYDTVTSCKLWRQVGESFNPPRTCTTVSWSFRCFYEKALLDYERHKVHGGELHVHVASPVEPMGVENQVGRSQAFGPVRVRRDAAARAMQGWHSQRLLSNGYVGDSPIKDKSPVYVPKREKQLKSLGVLKRKEPSSMEHGYEAACIIGLNQHVDAMVVDIGPSADWVKINVRRTKDCFEIYALVPGLLREEVRVQSDPAGRLVISGEPEHPDNPWGVTPFKKVVSLPSRIDPQQTSAVVTLHGQLFVRAPFEQSAW